MSDFFHKIADGVLERERESDLEAIRTRVTHLLAEARQPGLSEERKRAILAEANTLWTRLVASGHHNPGTEAEYANHLARLTGTHPANA